MSHPTAPAPAAVQPPTQIMQLFSPNERPIGRYDFEGGAYVLIDASGDLDTEEALDMVETLIQLKRNELERANKRATSSASDVIADKKNDESL